MNYFISSYLSSSSNFGYEYSICQEQFFLLMTLAQGDRGSVRGKKYDSEDEHNFLGQLTGTVHMFIMFKLLGD